MWSYTFKYDFHTTKVAFELLKACVWSDLNHPLIRSFFLQDKSAFLFSNEWYSVCFAYQLPYEFLTPLQAAVGVVQKVQFDSHKI